MLLKQAKCERFRALSKLSKQILSLTFLIVYCQGQGVKGNYEETNQKEPKNKFKRKAIYIIDQRKQSAGKEIIDLDILIASLNGDKK